MPDHTAKLVEAVAGTLTTPDGKHVLFKLILPGGAELPLALPYGQLGSMISGAALGLVEGQKNQGIDPAVRNAFETTWWELGGAAGGPPVLSFQLLNGGRLDFELQPGMLEQMFETLSVKLGKTELSAAGTPLN